MTELKDPAIKLFGKTISLPQIEADSSTIDDVDRLLLLHHHHHHRRRRRDNQSSATTTTASQDDKNTSEGELTGNKQEDDSTNLTAEESTEPATVSGTSDENKISGVENETISPNRSKKEEQDDSLSQEKTLKKPDKIIPCPRCNSMDTKFCYYNNYNVNQPRHFCKNCQRYWTAGGTMRNVPVGSGRRKNKNSSCANYRHIMISDALQAARVDVANGIHLPSLKANGTVLTFGSERPLCESISTALNLAEVPHNHFPNGFHGPEQKINIPSGGIDIAKDNSNGTSSITTCSTEIGGSTESVVKNSPGYLPHVSPFPGPPWPCPWNAPQWRAPLPAPAFSPPGFPVSFYPVPAYWGCAPPGPWNMPWPSPAPSSSDNSALSSGPTSPTLGKHSRDGNILSPKNLAKENPSEDKNKERCILIPKTLRIDDPNEAAKSSIWSTLGIQKDKADPISRTSLFKAFPSKHDEKNHIADTSLVLQANPAAYSRSQNFQESM